MSNHTSYPPERLVQHKSVFVRGGDCGDLSGTRNDTRNVNYNGSQHGYCGVHGDDCFYATSFRQPELKNWLTRKDQAMKAE